MVSTVKKFKELNLELQEFAGGKGKMLAIMFQKGFPVPEGFIILPSAFEEEKLNDESWNTIKTYLNEIRKKNKETEFAVRSSALSEDSAKASFAGEFETVTNVKTDKEIYEAIYTVFKSRKSERVNAYSSIQGMEKSHEIAVIIQLMVQSDISGVLFTADPITGSHISMAGNFVYGLGEQLVSGESNAHEFKLNRPKGNYNGPKDFKKYASKLYKYASKLVKELEAQQDIEWAVAKGKLYLLQTRPITTLQGNPDTYELNDSLDGDFLWTNTNVGEAMSDVFTPLSWSILRAIDEEQMPAPGFYSFSGNICGRAYSNMSVLLSIYPAFGRDMTPTLEKLNDIFGKLPEGIDIPIYPFGRLNLIKAMIPLTIYRLRRLRGASKKIPQYLKDSPQWCRKMVAHIGKVKTKEDLLSLWENELLPNNFESFWVANAGARKFEGIFELNKELIELLGTEDANALLSNLRGNSEMASLGPVVSISKIIKGEMSREEYSNKYGHRGPHEFELSIPDPSEDENWLEKQIEEFKKSNTDVEGLLKKQQAQYVGAWTRFKERFPKKANKMGKKIAEAANGSRQREAYRSEWTRVFRVNRAFALKVGELTGIGNDVFFLYIDEILKLLSGDKSVVEYISTRKENYEKYKELPQFPSIIRGHFDPLKWIEDPDRRVDYYDPSLHVDISSSISLKGFAGAAGRVEGNVRVLKSMEEGENLLPGEILVASTTNVGWTPLFPKAGAIITDIGAPLSHAAIVARELGIPAVVGCGDATTRLKTGDRVIVDGGHGIVEILN